MGESSESRIDFIQDYTLKSLRLKYDKWARMMVSDEQRSYIVRFIDQGFWKIYILIIIKVYFNLF